MLKELAKGAARWTVAKKTTDGGLFKTGLGYLATRLATRSVPGALLVGGAFLGKHFWNRHKARKLTAAGAESTTDHDALARAEADARAKDRDGTTNTPSQIGEIGSND